MTMQTEEIADQLLAYLRDDVEVELVGSRDGRIGCLTPLQYPDGDNVVVWVLPGEASNEVTDFGESVAAPGELRGNDTAAYYELVAELARVQGASFGDRRLTARCDPSLTGECVWRVAAAAANIARMTAAVTALRSRRPPREPEFVLEITDALQRRSVPVERERRLNGRSGHEYRATIFVPTTETVVEPIGAHWNQVTAAYVEFGDLRNANGYHLYAVLDDRKEPADEDAASLLAQVGSVVQWSRRREWLDQIA